MSHFLGQVKHTQRQFCKESPLNTLEWSAFTREDGTKSDTWSSFLWFAHFRKHFITFLPMWQRLTTKKQLRKPGQMKYQHVTGMGSMSLIQLVSISRNCNSTLTDGACNPIIQMGLTITLSALYTVSFCVVSSSWVSMPVWLSRAPLDCQW